MKLQIRGGHRVAALLVAGITLANCQAATFLASDVQTWLGVPAGAGVNEAFLVVDWSDSQPAWVWGYRWAESTPKTGADMLGALVLAEPRFTLDGLSVGFVQNIAWSGSRFQPGYNATTGEYWNYFVNNAQQPGNFIDGAAPVGAHVLPPLGSPFDEAGPGEWVSSNTGLYGRPLVAGSWDGFVYAGFTSTGPSLPINAPAIPEPSSTVLLFAFGTLILGKRRR